ncbi:PucR family transcriptional regulator [Paraconexibacter sp.]|uniref:PucR family transcriptional regulator n=1 Tax=Paraconexibacter sp. TaxID=2949640 RepID=UPI003563137B
MPTPPNTEAADGLDITALDAVTDAVESGAGLPEIVRAAARALGASLVLADRAGTTLAVAARSTADERALAAGASGVEVVELRVADEPVGTLRMRVRGTPDPMLPAVIRLVTGLIAGEVERLRAPERASQEEAGRFLRDVLDRNVTDREEIVERAAALGFDAEAGASLLVARAHPRVTTEDGWRARVLAVAERGARAVAPTAVAALNDLREGPGAEIVILLPSVDEDTSVRAAAAVLRELEASLAGFAFAVGRSRLAEDPTDLHRAGNEALLAANVAEGGDEPVLSFEETGAYRLLLSAMSEDPAELQRFYAETVEPLVAYDEQYETDLVQTVEAFLEADGNVAGTAQRLFTHRHTIRYRLERVRDLSGLDVGSTDGREKLSLGLKAMRVLGISHRGGPASEAGSVGGRVPRRS